MASASESDLVRLRLYAIVILSLASVTSLWCQFVCSPVVLVMYYINHAYVMFEEVVV